MIYIAHRINTLKELQSIPCNIGIEIDVRDFKGELVLAHDPFVDGEKLVDFLNLYHHKMLVINVKSSGIEKKILDILNYFNISNFFFLDSSMSQIFTLKKLKQGIFAGRVSEFESIVTINLSVNLLDWVWVDCFTMFSMPKDLHCELKYKLKLKTCLTSPDLLGREEDINLHAKIIKANDSYPDAICTKFSNIKLWKEMLE